MLKLKVKKSKFKVKVQSLKFLLLSLSFAFFAFSFTLDCFAQDKIIAIVNADVITQKELDEFIKFSRLQLAEEYQGKDLEVKVQSLQKDLLDKLIEDKLIIQEARKSEKNNEMAISDARVKARIDEIRQQYASEADFQKALAQRGMVQADLEAKIKEQLMMYAIVDRKIRTRVSISPIQITEYYEQNKEQFKIPEQWEFDSIATSESVLAKEISVWVNKGETMENMVKKSGLRINKIKISRGQLKKDIEDAIFKLSQGHASAPIWFEGQYYVFKLDAIIPEQQQPLAAVQEEIKFILTEEKMRTELDKWLGELKKHSYIKILEKQP